MDIKKVLTGLGCAGLVSLSISGCGGSSTPKTSLSDVASQPASATSACASAWSGLEKTMSGDKKAKTTGAYSSDSSIGGNNLLTCTISGSAGGQNAVTHFAPLKWKYDADHAGAYLGFIEQNDSIAGWVDKDHKVWNDDQRAAMKKAITRLS